MSQSNYTTLNKYDNNNNVKSLENFYAGEYNSGKFEIFKTSGNKFRITNIDGELASVTNPSNESSTDISFKVDKLCPNDYCEIKSVNVFMKYDSNAKENDKTPVSILWSPVLPITSQYFLFDGLSKTITIKNIGMNLKIQAPPNYSSPVDGLYARVYITWGKVGM